MKCSYFFFFLFFAPVAARSLKGVGVLDIRHLVILVSVRAFSASVAKGTQRLYVLDGRHLSSVQSALRWYYKEFVCSNEQKLPIRFHLSIYTKL